MYSRDTIIKMAPTIKAVVYPGNSANLSPMPTNIIIKPMIRKMLILVNYSFYRILRIKIVCQFEIGCPFRNGCFVNWS